MIPCSLDTFTLNKSLQDNRFDVPKAKRTTGIPRTFLDTREGAASPPAAGRSSPSLPTE